MLTNYLYYGTVDDWKHVSGYVKGRNRVDAKRRLRKRKSLKGIKYIKVLECVG